MRKRGKESTLLLPTINESSKKRGKEAKEMIYTHAKELHQSFDTSQLERDGIQWLILINIEDMIRGRGNHY